MGRVRSSRWKKWGCRRSRRGLPEALAKKLRWWRQLGPRRSARWTMWHRIRAGAAAEGGETVTASLTAEQQGDATRAEFVKDARVNRAAALKASDDARRAARSLRSGGAAPEEGGEERTGLGVGYGVFDAVYKPPAGESPAARYGRNYAEVAQDWEARLGGLRAEWGLMNVTVRLFKVGWQGQELSRGALVKVLQQVLEPIGEVQSNLAVYSEISTIGACMQANGDEEVLGFGGGMYVPIVMKDLGYGCSQEKKAQMMELWGGAEPEMSEGLEPGNGVQFWTAQQATSLLECLC